MTVFECLCVRVFGILQVKKRALHAVDLQVGDAQHHLVAFAEQLLSLVKLISSNEFLSLSITLLKSQAVGR